MVKQIMRSAIRAHPINPVGWATLRLTSIPYTNDTYLRKKLYLCIMNQNSTPNMYKGLASYFLPEGVLEYFDVTDFAEVPTKDKNVLYTTELHIYLDERDNRRGRKPQRLNTRFKPPRLENNETLVEALTRCAKQLGMSRNKWSKSQVLRGRILFSMYPKLRKSYSLIHSLRCIFSNKSLNKETAKVKLKKWYDKVAACTIREVKSVRDTIQFYEDEILNYFISRQTNASAESLNSKIKCFRSQVKGVSDIPFFMYRLCTVLG